MVAGVSETLRGMSGKIGVSDNYIVRFSDSSL